jgi:hypothetical protein
MKKLNAPQSQTQEVLYYLINRIKIDRRQMMLSCGVLNLPDKIMRLRRRYGLKIDLNEVNVTNKFGRDIKFGEYILQDKKKASEVYKTMQLQDNKNERV